MFATKITTTSIWIVFILSHMIFGIILRVIYFQKTNIEEKLTNEAIFYKALEEEVKALKPYVEVGLPLAMLTDIILYYNN